MVKERQSQLVFHGEGTPVTVTGSVSWTATTSCCWTWRPPPEGTPISESQSVFHGQKGLSSVFHGEGMPVTVSV